MLLNDLIQLIGVIDEQSVCMGTKHVICRDVPDIQLYPIMAGYRATVHYLVPVPGSQETG